MDSIRVLPAEDFDAAAGVLARAFDTTEQWRRMVPLEGDARVRKLDEMFRGTLTTAAAAKSLTETTADLEGVAIWFPPGRTMGMWPMIRSGFAGSRFLLTRPRLSFRTFMRALREFEASHKRVMPEPHWYLMALGVDPEHAGCGHGSALVRHGIEKAEADGKPAYLETELDNVGFYERLGFTVVEEVLIKAIDLPFALMRRPGSREGT